MVDDSELSIGHNGMGIDCQSFHPIKLQAIERKDRIMPGCSSTTQMRTPCAKRTGG